MEGKIAVTGWLFYSSGGIAVAYCRHEIWILGSGGSHGDV